MLVETISSTEVQRVVAGDIEQIMENNRIVPGSKTSPISKQNASELLNILSDKAAYSPDKVVSGHSFAEIRNDMLSSMSQLESAHTKPSDVKLQPSPKAIEKNTQDTGHAR